MTMPTPWMTFSDSLQAKSPTFENTMFDDGFFHVLATCWRESTASGKKWGYGVLVDQNRKNSHFSNHYTQFHNPST